MPIIKPALFSTAVSLGLLCAGQRSVVQAQRLSPNSESLRTATYDGKWSGTIKCLYDPHMWPDDECDVLFEFQIQSEWMEVKQTIRSKKGEETTSTLSPKLRFGRLATNAVAVSMNTGNDADGTWVETWSFVMSLKDQDHMIVHWTRIVNNVDVPVANKGSKFSSAGMGEMVRSHEAH